MTQPDITEHPHGITTIDTGFKRPGLVASHLVVEGGKAAFVDVGAAPAVPILLEVLERKGIAREDVELVLVTHVHLDHGGAAGVLMRALPNARLVVHPRGARHMIDPSRLIAGAAAVYGETELRARFGEIVPVPEERLVEAPDGFRLDLNGRELLFLDTPGHAKHHYCVFDARSRGFFTGDTFGLSYREFDTANGAFIFPTTTPVQFDPDALHASIDRLLEYRPERMFLTHFGCVTEPARLAGHLHAHIDGLAGFARQARNAGEGRRQLLEQGVADLLLQALSKHGCRLGRNRILDLIGMDIELNAQGLDCWLD